jgi:formylglycine-generating enzyme required for sulfatase activity
MHSMMARATLPTRNRGAAHLTFLFFLCTLFFSLLVGVAAFAGHPYVRHTAEQSVSTQMLKRVDIYSAVVLKDGRGAPPQTIKIDELVTMPNPSLQIKASPVPQHARLLVTSSPDQANVFISGERRGQTPFLIDNADPGEIELVIKKGCYQDVRRQVEIEADSEKKIHVKLELFCGNLELTSQPVGAEVFIGKRKYGITPCTLKGVKAGRRTLILKRNGALQKKVVTIRSGQTLKENIVFERPTNPRPGQHWQEPVTGMVFVWVRGGCYAMGSAGSQRLQAEHAEKEKHRLQIFFSDLVETVADTEPEEGAEGEPLDQDLDEGPVHEVCVDACWVGLYEVTNKEFFQFSAQSGVHPEWQQEKNKFNVESGDNPYYRQLGGSELSQPSRPVVGVSWRDTRKFSRWFSRTTGFRARLLTEAEWEYMCRSGGRDEEFAGADTPEQVAWYIDNSNNKCHAVGRKQANGLGLFDMSGNVWEWTMDTYDQGAYAYHKKLNPIVSKSAEKQERKVVRGGSWRSRAKSLRCVSRYGLPPEDRHVFLGFRLMMEGNKP